MKLNKIVVMLLIIMNSILTGNHVCYKKKIIINGEKRYIGCSKENRVCKYLGKRGFGNYYSKKRQRIALWQCSSLSEKEIKVITCRNNPKHRWCRKGSLKRIKRDSHNRIKIDDNLGKKMCEQGKKNCLLLGGTNDECSDWCR